MNTARTTLSLRLPPEALRVLPALIAAKVSGKPREIERLKWEYDTALRRAHEKERLEREQQERYECEEREHRERQEWWERTYRNIHFYLNEELMEEFLPAHSSHKGFRRLLSEHPQAREIKRYGEWGSNIGRSNEDSRNCGRKPRKPRYK